jgi:hypothetical protein
MPAPIAPAGAAPAASPSFLPFTRPTIDEATIAGVAEVLRSGWLTSGPQVQAFEAKLSDYCGGRPVRVFNSGTCTMEIALRIAGIGPGHEVITTPLSWVATSHVILEVGAKPVFVDVDPRTRNLDLDRVEAAITPATRAILPVDLAGLPVDRDRLYALAHRIVRRFRFVQLPSEQEHHLDRGGGPRPQRRARGGAGRAVSAAGRRAHRLRRYGGGGGRG